MFPRASMQVSMQAQKENDWNLRRMSQKMRGKTEVALDRMLLIATRENIELLTSLDTLEDAINRLGEGPCLEISWESYLNSLSWNEQDLHIDRLFYPEEHTPQQKHRRRAISHIVNPRAHGVEDVRADDQAGATIWGNADFSHQAIAATAFVTGMAFGSELTSRRNDASSSRLSICCVD